MKSYYIIKRNKRYAAHFSSSVLDGVVQQLLAAEHPDFTRAMVQFHVFGREDGIIVAITSIFDLKTQYATSKLIPLAVLRYKRIAAIYGIVADYLRMMAKELVAHHQKRLRAPHTRKERPAARL